MKLLLHSCCAPCSNACVEWLRDEILHGAFNAPPDFSLFWYNPNIHPLTEYNARMESLVSFADGAGLELLTQNEYGLRDFLKAVNNSGNPEPIWDVPARCALCYRIRLEKTARLALEKGFSAFSTTLLASPYQKHDLIRQTGEECARETGVDFFYWDFRPRFHEGQKKARESGSYMQKYCGCIFSEEERYLA